MKKCFLLVFDSDFGTSATVKSAIDQIAAITDWRYDMDHCIYLVSDLDAHDLSALIKTKLPTGKFLVAEIDSDYRKTQGWILPDSWYFLSHKRQKPKS